MVPGHGTTLGYQDFMGHMYDAETLNLKAKDRKQIKTLKCGPGEER